MVRASTLPSLAADEHQPRHAMRADWVDPEDIKPNASHRPRRITGWRRYCPLRRMSGHPVSGISERQIMAADKLREQFDMATMGYSGERTMVFIARCALPRWGLGPAAVAQLRAARDIRRVARLFSAAQLALIDAILLRNLSLREWSRSATPPLHPATEKRSLMVVLYMLAEYYDTELKEDLDNGRRLAP